MRMHVAINVRNLESSVEFYKKLFNAEPSKVKDNYAKFELSEPALHFSLNVRPYQSGGVLNHCGFQVGSKEEVLASKHRLQEAGLFSLDEMDTTCCYAVQDKIWVTDPEGNSWEVFYTREDSEFESADALKVEPACCTPITKEDKSEEFASACCVESLPTTEVSTPSGGSACGCQK